jgi:effector-binding domain-containing protein
MKALLKILYFFLVLIIIFLLVGVFLPKSAHIGSSILIKSSPEIIFDQVNNLKNWDNWAPWQNNDSTINIKFSHIVSGIGASYQWTSKNSGTGKIIIVESNPLTKVVSDMDFGKQGLAKSSWTLKEEAEGTIVNWNFENGHLKYFERYFLLFFKKNIIRTLDSGLKKLKETSEELRLDRISEVKDLTISPIRAVVITDSSVIQHMGEKTGNLLGKIKLYLERRKIEPVDKPFTLFKNWENEGLKTFACGFPIAERTWSWQEYQYIEIDSCHAIMVTHWGRYGSEKPYIAINQYMNDKNLILAGSPWEIYINNPQSEKDTSKWQTDIYFPVRSR